jgi:hypothetical protein
MREPAWPTARMVDFAESLISKRFIKFSRVCCIELVLQAFGVNSTFVITVTAIRFHLALVCLPGPIARQ